MPYPTSRVLEMTSPVRFRAELEEPAIPEDPDTARRPGQLPTVQRLLGFGRRHRTAGLCELRPAGGLSST